MPITSKFLNYGVKEDIAIQQAHAALSQVGLDESFYKRSPFELSGGEKRRVAIAGILILNPDILVLDEPTAGLDPQGTKIVLDLIRKLHNDGKTIILVTHDMNIVLNYATDVVVLKGGRLAFEGSPQELFRLTSDDLALDVPPLYAFAKTLLDSGLDIKIENIHTLDDLFKEIERVKHE